MYSSEIEAFLKERNWIVTPEECARIVNVVANPQITHMSFLCENNKYTVSTDDGYTFVFRVKGD